MKKGAFAFSRAGKKVFNLSRSLSETSDIYKVLIQLERKQKEIPRN